LQQQDSSTVKCNWSISVTCGQWEQIRFYTDDMVVEVITQPLSMDNFRLMNYTSTSTSVTRFSHVAVFRNRPIANIAIRTQSNGTIWVLLSARTRIRQKRYSSISLCVPFQYSAV